MSEPGGNENEAIARRAYEIWEAEGRPHGRHREHWEAAARELGSPAPMPTDYRDGQDLPGLAAAGKKPAARRKKPLTAPEAETTPKPRAGSGRRRQPLEKRVDQADSACRSRAAERAIASSSRSKLSLPAISAPSRLRARETLLLTVPTRVPSTSAASS